MINNTNEFVKSLWNWDILNGCFGDTHIKPSDIDGMVERNGHFLYLETKATNAILRRGQTIAIENRIRDGVSTVIVVWGDTNAPVRMKAFYPVQYKRPATVVDCDLAVLRLECQSWYLQAEKLNARECMRAALGLQ
jgi:hypothetical protein